MEAPSRPILAAIVFIVFLAVIVSALGMLVTSVKTGVEEATSVLNGSPEDVYVDDEYNPSSHATVIESGANTTMAWSSSILSSETAVLLLIILSVIIIAFEARWWRR